ncbi:hypothetical protein J5681_06070 [bacterium]|nr:hypothetical protein [bacterium]
MRVFFLVLLLILNVYAEAKSSGSSRSRSQGKKQKTTVVEKKTAPKSVDKSTSVEKSKTTPISTTYDAVAEPGKDDVVRDTIVDTVYVVMPDTTKLKSKTKNYNIPLPHQTAFLGKGLSVGIGAGLFKASDDCDCLGVWQGQLEYHYSDFITGGLDVRFFGGTLDRDVMLMYQRYRLNVRVHKAFSWVDFYASALLGLETTDLSEFRKEIYDGVHKKHDVADSNKVAKNDDADSSDDTSEDSDDDFDKIRDKENNCEKMFALDGFTLGFEVGMGVKPFRYLGFMGNASYEFNFSWAQLVSFSPGIALNLQEIWPWAGKNLRSTWISFEVVFQRYFNRNVKEWALAGFVGIQFGI